MRCKSSLGLKIKAQDTTCTFEKIVVKETYYYKNQAFKTVCMQSFLKKKMHINIKKGRVQDVDI